MNRVCGETDRVSIYSDSSSSSSDSCYALFSKENSDILSTFSLTPPTSPNAKLSYTPSSSGRSRDSCGRPPTPEIFENYYCHYFTPVPTYKHLLKSASHVPSELSHSDDFMTFLATPGTVWVDKMHHVLALCPKVPLVDKLVMIRRPAGHGQTTFVTTGMFAYDYRHADLLHHVIPTLPSTNLDGVERGTLILPVDMGWAFRHSTTGDIYNRVNTYLNEVYGQVLYQHCDCLGLSPEELEKCVQPNAIVTFRNLMSALHKTGLKMVLFAEHINWPLIHSTPHDVARITDLIDMFLVQPVQSALEQGLIVGGVLLGHPLTDEPAWVHSHHRAGVLFDPIACDRSDDKDSQGAFGFTLPEVVALAEELLDDPDARASFIDDVQGNSATYRHEGYIEYSMNDVLFRMRQRTGQPERCGTPGGDDDDDLCYYTDSDEEDDMEVYES